MAYADVEQLLVALLDVEFPAARLCTELPDKFETLLPVIQVERIGGVDTVPSLDNPNVDIEVYAATRVEAKALADQVREFVRFHILGSHPAQHVSVTYVSTTLGPGWRPYANPGVRRVGATYRITLHNTA